MMFHLVYLVDFQIKLYEFIFKIYNRPCVLVFFKGNDRYKVMDFNYDNINSDCNQRRQIHT